MVDPTAALVVSSTIVQFLERGLKLVGNRDEEA